MKTNLLYKLFGQKTTISRQEIDDYIGGNLDEKATHSIEKKLQSSSFDQDALDGFQEMGLTSSSLKKLDSKFNTPRTSFGIYLLIGSVLIIGSTLFFYMMNESQTSSTTIDETSQTSFYEEEDIISLYKTDSTTAITNHEATEIKELIKFNTFHQEQNSEIENTSEKTEKQEEIHIKKLPKSIQPIRIETHKNLSPARQYSKEIYLSDLKFIDFRGYRLAPIKVKGIEISGTSAEFETHNTQIAHHEWDEKDIDYHTYLSKTASLIYSGDYTKALHRLETILTHYPTDENALFYSGFCLYNLNIYDKAIQQWNEVQKSFRGNFYEESLWYILKSHVQLGNKEDVKQIAQKIVSENGFYAKQALGYTSTKN
jgi:TolA-binding protein